MSAVEEAAALAAIAASSSSSLSSSSTGAIAGMDVISGVGGNRGGWMSLLPAARDRATIIYTDSSRERFDGAFGNSMGGGGMDAQQQLQQLQQLQQRPDFAFTRFARAAVETAVQLLTYQYARG